MHDWIRDLTDMERLGIYLYAREVFPDQIPMMHGTGYPKESRDAILAKLDEAKSWMSEKARTGPLQMLMMCPDPHGTGGSSDNGNTARKFFDDKYRNDILDLYPTATATEREAIGQIHLL